LKLSVIILNYNVRHYLELCLKSVVVAIKNIDAQIIVVDNNSTDESCQMVKQLFPSVELIENKENSGFSKGNNIGAAQAKGEYLCILNPDTVVSEDTFNTLINFADSQHNLGIVGCQLIDGKGQFLPESKRHIPTPKVAFQKLLGYTKNYYTCDVDVNSIGETDVLVGAFMLIKRNVYNDVGGFDEDYFMYGEDIDLSYKILKAGYANYYYGETSIIHFKGESTLKDGAYAKRFYGAMAIFYQKHFQKNLVFTALVKLGIKLVSKTSQTADVLVEHSKQTVIISEINYEELSKKLPQPITLTSNFSDVNAETLVVLDANYLSYKTIIEYIKCNKALKDNSYRIMPKNSKFIIGSDSAVNRGEVIHF
jgi:GT2 family glycosyltransferase